MIAAGTATSSVETSSCPIGTVALRSEPALQIGQLHTDGVTFVFDGLELVGERPHDVRRLADPRRLGCQLVAAGCQRVGVEVLPPLPGRQHPHVAESVAQHPPTLGAFTDALGESGPRACSSRAWSINAATLSSLSHPST